MSSTLTVTNLTATNLTDGAGTTSTFANINQGHSKAWVNFNTNTSTSIHDSFNTASLTDNATGDTTQTFTNAMGNANFASSGACNHGGIANFDSNLTIPHGVNPSTTTVRSQVSNSANSASDGPYISHLIHGDLA
tara:strand:+ start:4749 stop:5153 length:405 start_codon:yes stop_codon:yes gene_type:complete